jgi:hypothetical protein
MEILAVLAISLAAAGVAIFIVNRFLALFLGETTGESHFRGAELSTLPHHIRKSEDDATTKAKAHQPKVIV